MKEIPLQFRRLADLKSVENVGEYINRLVESLRELFEGGIRWQNLRSELVQITPDQIDSMGRFVVEHGLGKVPEIYIANLDRPGEVYRESSGVWTETEMPLRCTAVDANITLLVM